MEGTPRRSRGWQKYQLGLIEIRENLFQIFQFGQVVVNDIGIIGIVLDIVLMVTLSRVERLEGLNFCDDGARIHVCNIKLRDVGLSDALLFFAGVKNRGAVLGAGIRALAVPLGGIVGDGEKNNQKLTVGEF